MVEINDASQINSIHRLLTEHSLIKPEIERDQPNKSTNLSVAGNMLIYLVTPELR
jgi:hypothetical protein